MFNADDLYNKLREIETLVHEQTNPDGSFRFDPLTVMVCLEVSRRMIAGEEKSGENHEY